MNVTAEKKKSFTNRKPYLVTERDIKAWKCIRPCDFGCMLCGYYFKAGDTIRWIFTNAGGFECDGPDAECASKANELYHSVNRVMRHRFPCRCQE